MSRSNRPDRVPAVCAQLTCATLALFALLATPSVARADTPPSAPIMASESTPPTAPSPAVPFPPCILGTTSCGGHWVFVPDGTPIPGTSAATPTTPEGSVRRPLYEHANTWDLNIDGAFGRYLGDSPTWTGFVRARAGALFIREPLYNALGLTYEYSSLSKGTFGIQAEILHLDLGYWGQLGGLLDVQGHPGLMGAIGWSILGVEAQYRTYDGLGSGVAVYAKIRIPISIIARVFRSQPKSTPKPASATP